MSTPIKRKLSTILSADVAGYSQLMGADEEGTLRLLAAHRAIIDSIIDLHDGRVVNTAGDSVLAEFTSPVEAVRAAAEIQDALKTRNESLPEARRMVFRIGVNLGDVMIKGDDLLGDGVNVAARLQTLAEPGGICISGSVFDQIEGKLSLRFQDIGEQTLKNIARPVRALHLRGAAPGATVPARPGRRHTRRGATGALVGGGLIVLAGAAYLGGLIPYPGSRDDRRETVAWEAVKAETSVPAVESFLARFPAGAHADEARAKMATLIASARQAAEAERGATERARAEADLARLKAEAEATRLKAEAEAARLRGEAEATRARAETERKKAEEDRTAAGKARAEAEAARAAVEPPRPLVAEPQRPPRPDAPPRTAIAPPATGESRFDGLWVGELSCLEWRGGPAFQRPQRGVVRGGEMVLDLAMPGRPRGLRSTGQVRDDDSIELRGAGQTPAGRAFEIVIRGRFTSDRFTAQAEPPARPCSIQLSREPFGPRPRG